MTKTHTNLLIVKMFVKSQAGLRYDLFSLFLLFSLLFDYELCYSLVWLFPVISLAHGSGSC